MLALRGSAMRRFVLLLLCFCFGSAWAAGTVVSPSGSVAVVQDGARVLVSDGAGGWSMLSRTLTNPTAAGGAVAVAETYAPRLAGNSISVIAKRAVPAAFAISAAKESFLIGCQAGTELAQYLGVGSPNADSRVRCNVTDWLFDEGQASISDSAPGTVYSTYCFGGPSCVGTSTAYFSSKSDACNAGAASFAVATADGRYAEGIVTSGGQCFMQSYNPNGSKSTSWTWSITSKQGTVTSPACPAFTDQLTGNSFPKGAFDPGADGKCPTGKYDPISADRAKTLMDAAANIAYAASVMQRILDKGGSLKGASDRTLDGPRSVTGDPVTSTTVNPDGSTVTTTTTPTTTYNYSGPSVTWTTTNVTNVQTCTGAGSCSTSTTSTDNQQKGVCETNPAAAGCGGDPASSGSLYAKKDRTFQSVLTAGRDAILATPLGSAMGGFFTIAGGGTCPIWTWNIPYIKAVVVVDEFCSDWALSAYAVIKGAVLIIFAWVAFRWAVL